MDRISEDMEDIGVLSKDGSSAHVLSFALQPYRQERGSCPLILGRIFAFAPHVYEEKQWIVEN